ncbi:MAG: FtsX-like permease family protein [Candidatus Dormiibacterota bacterium]
MVGLISPSDPSAPYWLGQDYFGFGDGHLDAGFTSLATVAALPDLAFVQLPLVPSRISTENLDNLASQVSAYEAAAVQSLGLSATSTLFPTINGYVRSADLMTAIVLVVDLQLVLLTLFVLFGIVQRSAEARRREVALGKLRGLTFRQVLLVGLAEPAVLVLIALPVGLALAYLGMLAAHGSLLPNSLVLVQPVPFLAAGAAFLGGVIAAGAGVRGALTRPLSDELRAIEPKSSGGVRAALDAAALALALAGIVELLAAGVLNGSQPNPVAAFAPGLVAVAVAVVGVRLLPWLCAAVVRWTSNSRWLATGLAVRQVVRRPASLRQIRVLAIATGLACFAVTGWAAAGINRTVRADFVLGAARVLTVQVPNPVNIEEAVNRADPSGRYAMAVMLSSIPSENLLAVQVSRLRQVAYWPRNISATSEARIVKWLTPHLRPAMYLTGDQVRATITMRGNPVPPPDLVFNLVNRGGHQGVADFGFLSPGTHTYTTPLPAACSGGCHVLNLEPLWNQSQTGPQQVSYALTIASLDERGGPGLPWSAVTSRLADPGYWNPSATGIQTSAISSGGVAALVLRVHDSVNDSRPPGIVPGSLPQTIPGVVTYANSVSDPADASIEDFDGSTLNLNVHFRVVALPQLGYQGFLVDLQTAIRGENAPPSQTQTQVWLAKAAPSSIERSLEAQGIRVTSVRTPAADIASMNHGGLALAFLFFLFAAGAAAVLAIGAAVFSVFMTSRRRAFELAVLRAIGIPNRTLMRSLLGEQLLVLGPGVLLGIGAGLLGALMALPSVPEFASTAGGPPVELVFAVVPIVAMVVVLVALLAVAASVASLATLKLASWDRLRTEIT